MGSQHKPQSSLNGLLNTDCKRKTIGHTTRNTMWADVFRRVIKEVD